MVIMQKGESQNGCFLRKQSTPNFSEKQKVFTYVCVWGGKNFFFSENLRCFVFLKHPIWDSTFLPYYRQFDHHIKFVFQNWNAAKCFRSTPKINVKISSKSNCKKFYLCKFLPVSMGVAFSYLKMNQKNWLGNQKIQKRRPRTPAPKSLFNKVVGLSPATLLKKRLWHRVLVIMRAIMIPYSEKAEM